MRLESLYQYYCVKDDTVDAKARYSVRIMDKDVPCPINPGKQRPADQSNHAKRLNLQTRKATLLHPSINCAREICRQNLDFLRLVIASSFLHAFTHMILTLIIRFRQHLRGLSSDLGRGGRLLLFEPQRRPQPEPRGVSPSQL